MTYTHTETNLPAENQYPKLVRDEIPAIILEHEGVEVPTRILEDDAEYETYLRRKIIEEAAELAATETDEHTIEEMADLEELIDALLDLKGLNRAQVAAAQAEKRQKRGGFAKRILMLEASKGNSRKQTKTLELTSEIKAPLERVWWAFTTAEGAEQWGAGPATFNATDGGEFSYWEGGIHGTNTSVVPMRALEQDWYGHDHPDEKYRAVFSFSQEGDNTTVKLTYSGNIYDEQRDISDWQEYYFNPIKKLLEE